MLQDQVVCDNDGQLGDDLDEVHTSWRLFV